MENPDQVVIIEERISKVNGEYTVKKYAKGKMLGKGGFAKCYQVENLETHKILAAKIIVKSTLTKTRARQKVTLVFIAIILSLLLFYESLFGFC